jgi:hypothetical protein
MRQRLDRGHKSCFVYVNLNASDVSRKRAEFWVSVWAPPIFPFTPLPPPPPHSTQKHLSGGKKESKKKKEGNPAPSIPILLFYLHGRHPANTNRVAFNENRHFRVVITSELERLAGNGQGNDGN